MFPSWGCQRCDVVMSRSQGPVYESSRDSGTLSSAMSDEIVLSIFNGRGGQGLCAVTVNGTALLPQERSPAADVDPMLLS